MTRLNDFCLLQKNSIISTKGPFATFSINDSSLGFEWTGMKFSPDGRSILIMTNGPFLRMVDAYNGNVTHTLTRENEKVFDFLVYDNC